MTKLAVEDPVIKEILSNGLLNYSYTKYTDPDVLLRTSRALACVNDTRIHMLWTSFMQSRGPLLEVVDEGCGKEKNKLEATSGSEREPALRARR